ncbi:MAG: DUF2905 domain-containing protein [Deltaproteobacteria bacterium]|nr:DUF2905 domain-containing protein [Deltaproteobacteria bacterium]
MFNAFDFGKILLVLGLIIAAAGVILMLDGKGIFGWIGRLPGDFSFKGKNFTFYFPLATSILVSIFLTLLLWLISRK